MSEWFRCSERLPKKSGLYIVYAKSADTKKPLIVATHYLPEYSGWQIISYWANRITHWMPMPKPPEVHKSKGIAKKSV